MPTPATASIAAVGVRFEEVVKCKPLKHCAEENVDLNLIAAHTSLQPWRIARGDDFIGDRFDVAADARLCDSADCYPPFQTRRLWQQRAGRRHDRAIDGAWCVVLIPLLALSVH